jgi:MFS family permease
MRGYGLTLMQTSLYFGAITLAGGISGMWLGGWLADRYGARNKAAYARVSAIALLLSAPFHVLGVLSPAQSWAFLVFVIPTALASAWVGPTICAIQHLVQPGMRALASALFLFVNNLIGLGLGSLLIGAMSDGLAARYGADSLRYAILAGTVFYLLGATLFALTSRRLARDWV